MGSNVQVFNVGAAQPEYQLLGGHRQTIWASAVNQANYIAVAPDYIGVSQLDIVSSATADQTGGGWAPFIAQ